MPRCRSYGVSGQRLPVGNALDVIIACVPVVKKSIPGPAMRYELPRWQISSDFFICLTSPLWGESQHGHPSFRHCSSAHDFDPFAHFGYVFSKLPKTVAAALGSAVPGSVSAPGVTSHVGTCSPYIVEYRTRMV